MKTQTSIPSAGPWAQLALFRIFKDIFPGNQPSLKVFNNTRQQCKVQIIVSALDANGNPVDIPNADLDGLELIDYVTGTPLTRVADFKDHPEWAYSSKEQGYLWDESKVPDTTGLAEGSTGNNDATASGRNAAEPHQQVISYYVSTRALSVKQVAARIRLSQNTYFTTNAIGLDDPDGMGRDGRFNLSVVIRPVAFPSLPVGNYAELSTDGTLLPHREGSSSYFYWATEHYLHVNYNGELLRLKSVSARADEMKGFAIYKQAGLNDDVQWAISYYSQPGVTVPENLPLPPLAYLQVVTKDAGGAAAHPYYPPLDMFKNCVGSVVGATAQRVVIGLITGNLRGQFVDAGYKGTPSVGSTTVHIVDVYGNDHVLSLSFGARVTDVKVAKA